MAGTVSALQTEGDRVSDSGCSSSISLEAIDEEIGPRNLSTFERIVSSYPPILESLVLQLPTPSLIDLYHTSKHLRSFFAEYPLAWRSLSFRLPQPAVTIASPGNDSPDGRGHKSKQNAMDDLLLQIVVPFGTRLKNLDLCNTAINGVSLMSMVLPQTKSTLQHLSVRGCKNVSIKYHILPFLQIHLQRPGKMSRAKNNGYALQSLYTYRCRHHRRRAYLPSSLLRRDSDSEPTHELIEICHQLGIWTDTAWCPTPGPRCFRRRDYYTGRAAPGTTEVWVPFDRLWRSSNRIGPNEEEAHNITAGKLWEEEEGYAGEALGTADQRGEGKETPAHGRRTHQVFVEGIKCDQCAAEIQERCEQCSVKMHCMGCRKTLCASCAFDRPLPRKQRSKLRQTSHEAVGLDTNVVNMVQSGEAPFWWAPGVTRSPNQIHEAAHEVDGSDSDSDTSSNSASTNGATQPATLPPPKLNMHWCCLEPVFSGGGGVAFIGPNVAGPGSDAIRATPLPPSSEFMDSDFLPSILGHSPDPRRAFSPYPPQSNSSSSSCSSTASSSSSLQISYMPSLPAPLDAEPAILPYLQQQSLDLSAVTCPRSLCTDCYRSFRWKIPCRACRRPICREHDLRALKVRKCGYRDMRTERDWVRDHERQRRRMEVRRARFNREDWTENRSGLSGNNWVDWDAIQLKASNLDSSSHAPMMESSRSTQRALSPLPYSSSRPRSLSLGGRRTAPTQPVPGHPQHPVQWQGCGEFFCQQFRPPGDSRPRCTASMNQCVDCGVLVCQHCRTDSLPCPCQPCTARYHCPSCALLPAARTACRLREEQEAQRAETAQAQRDADGGDDNEGNQGKQKRNEQALMAIAADEDGLQEMRVSASGSGSDTGSDVVLPGFPGLWMGAGGGGKIVNGIPEGLMWTFGFCPGGEGAVMQVVSEWEERVEGRIWKHAGNRGKVGKAGQSSKKDVVVGVSQDERSGGESSGDAEISSVDQGADPGLDEEEVDLALGVGEFFTFLESAA
ncbi:hypothetical protein EV356DRAFT_487189 [Viridothelium virens]|uniref:Uncharacterized protein n=1 Tax=Viridothelium virens TaxID=1048519 RepID=A0A6A6H5J1_VIRVR|nr:hypothetical protein EV356DRAFT_487189 [Viridothelium virens]